jgi:hypothetical protein
VEVDYNVASRIHFQILMRVTTKHLTLPRKAYQHSVPTYLLTIDQCKTVDQPQHHAPATRLPSDPELRQHEVKNTLPAKSNLCEREFLKPSTYPDPPLTPTHRSTMRTSSPARLFALALALLIAQARAGPVAYGTCQAACATLAVACYSTAGFFVASFSAATAGASTILGGQPVSVSCNAPFGTCSGACTPAFLMPSP